MKLIGKGAFSRVYRKNKNTVVIKSVDNVKECMSLGWFPKSSLFPSLKLIERHENYSIYESMYYEKVSSLKNNLIDFDYEFYNELKNLNSFYIGGHNGYDHWYNEFKKLPNKFHHRKNVLLETLDALSNYGSDIAFEISPRNVTVKNGKLILLDCFFFVSALREVREKKISFI